MADEKQRKTFLSYSRANKDFAIRLAKELKAEGFNIWLDQLDIPAGSRWDREVEKALRECEIFMIILTPASVDSENVLDEIGYAIDNRKRFLPVLLENCEVPLRLRRFQYVDFTNKSFDDGVNSAKELLRGLMLQTTIPRGATVADLQAQAEAEQLAKQKAEEELAAKTQTEREAKVEAERKAKEEAKRLAAQKADEERTAKAKAERKAKEEAERLAAQKGEEERVAKAKADREAKVEADRKAKEEAKRLAAQKAEAERAAEAERKAKEAADRLARQKAEAEREGKPVTAGKPFPKPIMIGAIAAVALLVICGVGGMMLFRATSAPEDLVASNPPVGKTATAPVPKPTNTTRPPNTPNPIPTHTSAPAPIILGRSEAERIFASGNWKGIFATAREQHTEDELNSFFDNSLPLPVTLNDPGPIVVGYTGIWCATTLDVLEDNLKYIRLIFRLDNKVASESNYVEDYYNDENGKSCYSRRIVIDQWTSGEYVIYQEITLTVKVNDGETDQDPFSESLSYVVTVP